MNNAATIFPELLRPRKEVLRMVTGRVVQLAVDNLCEKGGVDL